MTTQLPEGVVTLLFTDIVGSTDLSTSRGDEAAQQVLRTQTEIVRRYSLEHGGVEVKGLGDGSMVAFASARKAVACAVAIQRGILDEGRSRAPTDRILLRIGLNTGEVIHEDADLFGAAVNAAARIAAKAEGGQILISETTKSIMGHVQSALGGEVVDRGRFRLKGFPERWRLFEVVWQDEAAPVAPVITDRTPYVGREAERLELRRLLDQLATGSGALAMIGGEPGVGKTRIAEELMAEATQRGMTALIGHCYEVEAGLPYIPFVEALESALRMFPPEALRNVLGDSAPEVAKLLPELRRIFPDIPDPPELPPEQERRYLFNGMTEYLARAGAAQPLLLVLDDLHWADDATLLLVQHIAPKLPEMPVLIVGTYRDVELDVGRPLARAIESLHRSRLAQRITLRRLPQDIVASMLKALSGGQDPPAALVDVIYRETEGNPFFVEEVFQHLNEEGKLFDAQRRWLSNLELSELDVPEGVRLVIGRRLDHVGEECRRALAAAAVIGRAFNYDLLEALGEVDPDALLDAIDLAERANLVAAVENPSEARFTFVHELIRQTLLSGLSLPRRQRMHLRIAEAIEQVYSRDLESRATDLAHHFYQAGAAADPAKTVRYLSLAGDHALNAAAFEEAVDHFNDALQLADDDETRATLLNRRGQSLRSIGRWDEALADWAQAIDLFEGMGESETTCAIASHMGWLLLWTGHIEEALAVYHRGLAALGDSPSAARAQALGELGAATGLAGDSTGGAMIDEALEMASALNDDRLKGRLYVSRASHDWSYFQSAQEYDDAIKAAALLRPAGDLWHLSDSLWHAAGASLFRLDLEQSEKLTDEACAVSERVGHLGSLMVAERWRGLLDWMRSGDVDSYAAFGQRDLELCAQANMPWSSHSHSWLAQAAFFRGDWDAALVHQRRAVADEAPGIWLGADSAQLICLLAYTGERDEALSLLGEWESAMPQPGVLNPIRSWTLLDCAVEALAVLGLKDRAARLYPLVREYVSDGPRARMFTRGLNTTLAGIAAAAAEDWVAAAGHFEESIRLAEDLPFRSEQAEARRWFAWMLLARDAPGDRERARSLLTEAVSLYRDMRLVRHVKLAEELLAGA